jgi:serine/threonine protein kinase
MKGWNGCVKTEICTNLKIVSNFISDTMLTLPQVQYILVARSQEEKASMICSKCQFDNQPGIVFCGKCGSKLPSESDLSQTFTRTIPALAKDLEPGHVFANRFEVIEELGRGGMGTVFRVLDRSINEEIALKLLKLEVASDASIIERFKNELKLARKITHKSVCRMFDLNEEGGIPFITMEYVQGEDLKRLIIRDGKLSIDKATIFSRQIAEGLSEAHKLGVVHRDLKPQNIMIDQEGNIRIMDFGIARLITASELTEKGMMIGTPHYMSPEQAQGEAVDQRADIYALGVILFEMVTGKTPFQGESALSIAVKHKSEIPPDPREFNAQIPEYLNRLILKCLNKNKELRYQNAQELLIDLADKKMPDEVRESESDKAEKPGPRDHVRRESIAVLPFKDMSPQQDLAYLCDGLAEELINALTQVKGMKVAARTSSFSFKDKETDIREIGSILNVDTILEGSVQKAGNRLRITAQLISVSDGYHLWSERFDQSADDIFAIQDEISLTVVDKLRVELLDEEKAKVTKRHTENKEAYSLYLKGRYFWNRRLKGDMIRAVGFYQKAIDKDPEYALPYVGIADVFNIMGQWAYIRPIDAYTRSKAMLQKAMEIDSELSELYSSLAFMTAGYEWDLVKADKYLSRSIELNPNNTFAHGWRGEMLATTGRFDEALAAVETATQSDPLFGLIYSLHGIVLSLSGQAEAGREQIKKSIAMDPDNPMPFLFMGITCLIKPADPEQAVIYLEKAIDFGLHFAYGHLGEAYGLLGKEDKALEILERLDELEKENFIPPVKRSLLRLKPELKHFRFMKKKYVAPLLRALIYLGLNKQEEALDHLEMACEARDYFFPGIVLAAGIVDTPDFDELKKNPRFQAFKKKIITS